MKDARRAAAAYRLLLRTYPPAFRRRFGAAMTQLFRDRYRRAAAAGVWSTTRFLAATTLDVARNASIERVEAFRERLLYPRHHDPFNRHERGSMFFQSAVSDFRHAWRVFIRAPKGTTALAIATLALGIGANAAMFSVIYNVLIEPLPYPAVDRVSIAWRFNPQLGDVSVSPQLSDIEEWKAGASVDAIATYANVQMVMAGGDAPETLDAVKVDPGLLAFTGTKVALGRGFTREDAASAAAAHVVILSEGLWKRRFGATASVVGRMVDIDDSRYEVVGVAPSSFRLPLADTDILVPLPPAPAPAKGQRPPRTAVSALVRLKPGVTREAAQQELTALSDGPVGIGGGWRVRLMAPGDLSGPGFRRTLFILFGAVGCVLLIACANVAHLVLSRNAARRREIAVRLALGISRGRLARQLFFESLLLALLGATAGLAIGIWGVQAISALRPPQMPQLADIRVSGQIFGFGFVLALLTGVVFGLLPAITAARGASSDGLKQGGPSMHGRRGTLARRMITVAEVALALILLTGAALLLRSYARVLTADRGFKPDGLLAVKIDLPDSRYPSPAAHADFMRRVVEAVRDVAGVTRVIMASGVPPRGGLIFGELEVEGQEKSRGPSAFGGGFVQPGFFEALQIPLRGGRTFTEPDLKSDVVIVNERMANQHFGSGSAVGKRLRLGASGGWSTIVGVVGNVDSDHGEVGRVQLYFPLANPAMGGDTTLLVATSVVPTSLIGTIKQRIWALDAKIPLDDVESIEQAVAKVTARPRFNVVLLTVFAGIGLLLAIIGIYGVVSYSVGLRTREIGLRMALGAVPSVIARAVLKETLTLALIGSAIGLAGSLAGAQLMKKLLFGVSPNDPVTLIVVPLVLAFTALIAALLPARRAMRVDPMIALRTE